ncbi:hypothetical protein PGTUg99_010552 [Puccinia graminis f. sp. tritici]|uniref:Uncharacterized protein n=1 Tax=Puccinia graminis f. sp. tritici TaxID=56615 RepID=A0A5B0MGC8_PUCGR|nr:hypothetical protein PGTUg99_010552 [Puccinia graminis f. sp. tritici]
MNSETPNSVNPTSLPSQQDASPEDPPTPPPSSQVLAENFPGQLLTAPTFEEFSMLTKLTSIPEQLNPNQSILDSEIQQITAEEFHRNITTAETTILGLIKLKLPKSLKRKIDECAHDIKSSKITSASTSTRRPVKRKKDSPSVNPASLLTNGPISASSASPSAPANVDSSNAPAIPTTSSLPTPVLAITPTTPAVAPAETTFDKISQTISPGEVFKPVDSPSTQLPQGVQITQDPSPPDENHGMLIACTIILNVDFVKEMLPTACLRLNTFAMYPGQPPEEDHQSSENQPEGSSANLQVPNNQNNSTTTTSSVPPPPPNPSTSQPPASTDRLTNLTILKSSDARISVIKIYQHVDGVKPNWERYQTTWTALSNLAQFRAQSLQNPGPHNLDFHFERTTCSYTSWIKTISSLAPSPNDQWNCPDVIDFPLIVLYSQLEKSGSSEPFISPTTKTIHPESTIIRFLHRLQSPPPAVISEWAKIIAASVEVMAFKLYSPPPPTPDTDDDPINQGLQVLQWLEGLKNSLSTFETPGETQPTSAAPEGEVVLRSHAIDVLKDFSKVIIDVFMGYIIFQVHALSPPPLTNSQIKKQGRSQQPSAPQENSASAVTQKTTGGAVTKTSTSTKKLKSIQSRHNFQPLTYFLIGGVRGLFVCSRNHRTSPVSECMSFIQAMEVITRCSKVNRTPEEPIWKNLSAYIVEIFQPAFQSPGKIVPLQKRPDPHELAQAITIDFLTHWRTQQPSSPFLIPHSPHQITEK